MRSRSSRARPGSTNSSGPWTDPASGPSLRPLTATSAPGFLPHVFLLALFADPLVPGLSGNPHPRYCSASFTNCGMRACEIRTRVAGTAPPSARDALRPSPPRDAATPGEGGGADARGGPGKFPRPTPPPAAKPVRASAGRRPVVETGARPGQCAPTPATPVPRRDGVPRAPAKPGVARDTVPPEPAEARCGAGRCPAPGARSGANRCPDRARP